ncbi:MAG: hypothetical protein M3R25_09375 [Bacteroidota bacterium]|nr:hypothetical protein [Bacteroidota bacterium]
MASVIVSIVDGKVETGTYNLVEHIQTINEIAADIQLLYPRLDIIHANHNIRMKDVMTAVPCRIWSQVSLPNRSFQSELMDFKNRFSF